MAQTIVGYAVEFLIQTVFLTAGLWIMIKLQKLNYHFLGLIATAAVSTVVEMVLDRFIGGYFSTPFVCAVLFLCVWKVTDKADTVDVAFTVAVGGALVFGMNLFLLSWLMGDLRPSAKSDDSEDEAMEQVEAMLPRGTNATIIRTVSQPDTNRAITAPVTRPVSKIAATNSVKPVARPRNSAPAKIGKGNANSISVKSISNNANSPTAILFSGVKNYTILRGETISMQIPGGGTVVVRCDDIKENRVDLIVEGEPVSLSIQ